MTDQRHNNAIDTLHKIAALTSAAQYLCRGEEEGELAIELMDIVLKTALRFVEVTHDA